MNILFLCTDNFTRSVIAEYCMTEYLKKTNNCLVNVASAGIRADSDISKYSSYHFKLLNQMGIDTSTFKRTQFDENCLKKFDMVIGMSELHKDYVKEQFNFDILLFNEVYNGEPTPVNIGEPNNENFLEEMNQLVNYINNAVPTLLNNLSLSKL
ncbi:hypothetical protein CN692_05995 [Bacillus sp. AFS002410]|uniref:arsenate reductase/protein-tyrosine-phosphatase family protein n=1 Tax=Bacillus sp. AFS002410 TaxID=2033481 RepID=UPI000BF22464|nr:hypothetical protein [Bacillus sp. AFS002410]PEJ59028.1 hypothetical protein CN692_05995 [Bacillus sp. AFS002410]